MLRVEIKRNRIPGLSAKVRRSLTNINMTIAELIAEEARLNVLRQGLLDSGFLFSSIVAQADPSGIRGESEVIVGAYYGIFHEFGTVHMRARPFLGPAVEKYKNMYAAITSDVLNVEIESSPTATYDIWKGFYPSLGMPSMAAITGTTRRHGSKGSRKINSATDPGVFGSARRGSSLYSATRSGSGIRVSGGIIGSRARDGIPIRRIFNFVKKLVGDL